MYLRFQQLREGKTLRKCKPVFLHIFHLQQRSSLRTNCVKNYHVNIEQTVARMFQITNTARPSNACFVETFVMRQIIALAVPTN